MRYNSPMRLRSIITVLALALLTPWAQAAGLGWRVSDGAGNHLYLVGTVHAATKDMYPLPEPITAAFESARILVLEVDPRNLNQREMERLVRRYGMLSNRESLRDLLPEETWSRLVAWGQRVSLSPGQLNRMKPWLATTTLVSVELASIGVDRALGMEPWLTERAIERGMQIQQLETAEEQIAMLGGLPMEAQVAFLENSILDAEEFSESVGELLGAWRDGNLGAMAALLADAYAEQPLLYEVMIAARNHRWMKAIGPMLASGQIHYVAVGALHLVGPDGLVALLLEAGMVVERL